MITDSDGRYVYKYNGGTMSDADESELIRRIRAMYNYVAGLHIEKRLIYDRPVILNGRIIGNIRDTWGIE